MDSNQKNQSSSKPRISDRIPFEDVAKTLERIVKEQKMGGKKNCLEKLVKYYRKKFFETYGSYDSSKANGDSLYPLLRIFLMKLDRGREAYGFKSHALGRMLIQILGLDKAGSDAKRLLHYKDPARAGSSAGDIAEVTFHIMRSRFGSNESERKAAPTLSEIHDVLDKLARGRGSSDINQEDQVKILQQLFRKLTALEAKWLVRILIKSLHLGLSTGVVLGLLHKQASKLSERIGNLELLCQKLNDPSAQISELDITLFTHFSPMLATRVDIIESAFEAKTPIPEEGPSSRSKGGVSLPSPPFYVETKWDGERFQIHFDGKELKYFSRRAHDYSKKFEETVSPRLRPQISSAVKSFIMDGEMMAYSLKHKLFTQKGYNIDVKTINVDNPNHRPVFVAFDLVYLNGKPMTKVPLKERRAKLESVFTPKEDVIRFSEVRQMNSKNEVVDCLNSAIDDGEEGLIVKDVNSVYIPGHRGAAWLKIKPEYLEDNSVDDLDLVIMGAYYTDSTIRGGAINHFLLGLIDKSGTTVEYYPMVTVGTGRLRSIALKELVEKLRPKFIKSTTTGTSVWRNVHFRQRKKPDFLISPEESIVVQVKASEIIPTDVYAVEYTLRFPRIVRTREDKSPNDIMTLQEFHRLREACGGKLAKRTDGKGNSGFFRKRKQTIPGGDESDDEDMRKEKAASTSKSKWRKKSTVAAMDSGLFDDAEDNDGTQSDESASSSSRVKKTGALFPPVSPSTSNRSSSLSSPTKSISTSTTPSQSPQKFGIRNIFDGKVFCVYGTTKWKADMESKIRKGGGAISMSPDVSDLFCIVGQLRTSPRVQKAIQSGKYDIISPTWVLNCVDQGKQLPLGFEDYWGFTKETKENLKAATEGYSESYSQETVIDEKEEGETNEGENSMSLIENCLVEESPVQSPVQSPKSPSSNIGGATSSSHTTPVKSTASASSVSGPGSTVKEANSKKKNAMMVFDDDDGNDTSSSSDTDFEMEKKESSSDTDFEMEKKESSPDTDFEVERKKEGSSDSDTDFEMDIQELCGNGEK